MAITRNKLIPLLGIVAVAIVGTIVWKQMTSGAQKPAAGPIMQSVPKAELPATKGADRDTPQETLSTVVASNRELRETATQLIEENKALRREMEKNRPGSRSQPAVDGPTAATGLPAPQDQQQTPPSAGTVTPSAQPEPGVLDVFSKAFDRASTMADQIGGGPRPIAASKMGAGPGQASGARAAGGVPRSGDGADLNEPMPDGTVVYKVRPPMGYALHTSPGQGRNSVATSQYVRLNGVGGTAGLSGGTTGGTAARAAQAAQDKPKTVPFYTIPENATLAGVVSMTSLIGRVPIDGRVTDPMQWKAVVGRDNLAANGFELPDDLAGMIVSGIAIGDMALSCSEGKVRSLTFVFNDGTIRTVSNRRGGGSQGTVRTGTSGGGGSTDLGHISDLHGNPCISGKFVTNAPAYLTDIVGMKTLEVAGQAFSDAQRTVSQNSSLGTTSSTITGSVGSYALGQAVAGASDEVSKWLLARLKNSFDAVVTPSGQRMVIHLDTEIRIDKVPDGRLLVHRAQSPSSITARGARHGLE